MDDYTIYSELDNITQSQFRLFGYHLEDIKEHLDLLTKQILRLNVEIDKLKEEIR